MIVTNLLYKLNGKKVYTCALRAGGNGMTNRVNVLQINCNVNRYTTAGGEKANQS
jgi:hypothetical protein